MHPSGAASAMPSRSSSSPSPTSSAACRVCLVVDDSRVVGEVARGIRESHGFTGEAGEEGKVALEACQRGLPGCVLLDWNMPVMNGIEFLKALRSEFGPAEPPVLF